ncbi:MAG: DinB family protein [Flavobacteriaceae bacterium]
MTFELDTAIEILERTPTVMRQLLSDLPSQLTHKNEGGDSWSAFDVIGHLIHGEKTDWMVRTNLILANDSEVSFEPFNRFAQFENSKGKSLEQLLEEFAELRKANLNSLRSKQLSTEDLERTAQHPELGTVTLKNLLAAWVVHDLGHITQVSRVIAKQYKTEVGPWPKYLTILNSTPKE